jgi:hypothetical protein
MVDSSAGSVRAYRLAKMARMVKYAAAGADSGLNPDVSAGQFAADAVDLLGELEEAAYDIAGVIEAMPEHRMMS